MKEPTSVTISASDVDCITKFYENFGFTIPEPLVDAIDTFKEDQTLLNQRELTKQLAIAITEIKDETLVELFKPVIDACRETACRYQFADDIDKMLTVDSEEDTDQ